MYACRAVREMGGWMFDLVGYERSEVTGLGFVEWGMGVECDVIHTSSRSDNDEVCAIGLLW